MVPVFDPRAKTVPVRPAGEASGPPILPSAAAAPAPGAGAFFGARYRIERELGRGGMGEVFQAHALELDRDVGLKLLAPGAHDEQGLRRFEQEARAAGALEHPNVVAVHDVGTHDGERYIISELLHGRPLRETFADKPLPLPKALDFARQFALGLRAAHEKGVIHRDLKPENLFVTDDGTLKILDFGIAKVPGQGTTPSPSTDTGAVVGTVGYMSPEQVRSRKVDQRADIFSFGAILYQMLAAPRAPGALSAPLPPQVARGRGGGPAVRRPHLDRGRLALAMDPRAARRSDPAGAHRAAAARAAPLPPRRWARRRGALRRSRRDPGSQAEPARAAPRQAAAPVFERPPAAGHRHAGRCPARLRRPAGVDRHDALGRGRGRREHRAGGHRDAEHPRFATRRAAAQPRLGASRVAGQSGLADAGSRASPRGARFRRPRRG